MSKYKLVSFEGNSVKQVTEQINEFFKQNIDNNDMAVAKFSVVQRNGGIVVFMLCLM